MDPKRFKKLIHHASRRGCGVFQSGCTSIMKAAAEEMKRQEPSRKGALQGGGGG